LSDWEALFYALLKAETESDALHALEERSLLRKDCWVPLGAADTDNNFAIVGNQHSDPTGALVEKIINSIDAKLTAACHEHGVDPQGLTAPQTMKEAVEEFFGVRDGRLGDLDTSAQRQLATGIHVVAVGSKTAPSYLVIDDGEGQTPRGFPSTFMSLARANKLRIPFVQGKFNSGGTGVLQFCGDENMQLIASKRHPSAPVDDDDPSAHQWGFTIVRRIEPPAGDTRRNSEYVYLAPGGAVPAFTTPSVSVLPASNTSDPATPYARALTHGTVLKLYNYRWRAKSLATTEARYELEKYLHAPALPFRVVETRNYSANYFETTVAGIWSSIEADETEDERTRVEPGFPATAVLNISGVGDLVYKIVVFKPELSARHLPKGVVFTVNGQVHGELPSDFVSRRLEFEYIASHVLVSVDCTSMRTRVREDFFPAARDRIRRNETYHAIVKALTADLKNHPGLKALNASRRSKTLEKALSEQDDVVKTLTDLLNNDPALRALFDLGDRLVAKVGPTEAEPFKGQRFPSYFRLQGNPRRSLSKQCPVNRACKVLFETDAANDYFDRSQSPGKILFTGDAVAEYTQLWNGTYTTRWRPPEGSRPGDVFEVAVVVTDPDREAHGLAPFTSSFSMTVTKAEDRTSKSGTKRTRNGSGSNSKTAPRLALPHIVTVRKKDWASHEPPFTEMNGLRVRRSGEGSFDYVVNLDNVYLLTELSKAKAHERDLVIHWFKYGLAISAMGMIQHGKKLNGAGPNGNADSVDTVNLSIDGLASVIVPVIRTLHRMPA
jgi:hypothetical protein